MTEHETTLQNQPVDISEEFGKQENHFFVGWRVEEFDRHAASGTITWRGPGTKTAHIISPAYAYVRRLQNVEGSSSGRVQRGLVSSLLHLFYYP